MKNPNQAHDSCLEITRRDAVRRLLGAASIGPFALSLLGHLPTALADATGNTMRVEEDWYVKIGTPDPDYDTPQITTVIAPGWTLAGKYAVFDLNCATQPGFSSGGVQLQLWSNDAIVQTCSNTNWSSIHFVDEEIRYTSVMSIVDDNLVFEIINGTSQSWETFGNGELKLQIGTWRNHLNEYDPEYSTSNSRIGFSSHRVRNFTLERIRYYSANGDLKSSDDTPRVLHQYDPQG